jgi:hypothetical protein
VIEFLPPRDHAFGEADAADFVGLDGSDDTAFEDQPPRSRWLTVLAVVGVTGLLALGIRRDGSRGATDDGRSGGRSSGRRTGGGRRAHDPRSGDRDARMAPPLDLAL